MTADIAGATGNEHGHVCSSVRGFAAASPAVPEISHETVELRYSKPWIGLIFYRF